MNDTLTEALKEHRELIEKNETAIKNQKDSLLDLEKAMTESFEAANKMTNKVDQLEEEVNKILKMLGEMQVREYNLSMALKLYLLSYRLILEAK